METLILPKYVEKVDLSECESLKRVEWTTYVFNDARTHLPACLEELILPNADDFDFNTIGDEGKNLKILDISSATYVEVDKYDSEDETRESKNLDEITISGAIKKVVMREGNSDNVRIYLDDTDVDEDSDWYEVALNDSNRESMYKDLFGENVKVNIK